MALLASAENALKNEMGRHQNLPSFTVLLKLDCANYLHVPFGPSNVLRCRLCSDL